MRYVISLALAAVVSVVSGCTGNAFCAKRQECNGKLEDDSQGVCVENFNANISALRANEEDECQKLADAQLALAACAAQLDCDDFEEADLGQKCDQEQEDVEDATDDAIVRGEFLCSSSQ